jgi:YbbR domain-containing protein
VRRFADNLPLRLISLGLAVLLWLAIAGETTSEMALSVPLELQNFPKDLELTGDTVDRVEVRLRASPGNMRGLNPSDIAAQIDLKGTAEGERIVHLAPESFRLPFGVKVVKIDPTILILTFERTLQKVVPVRPRFTGRPAPGYEVAELSSEPGEVRIAGPKSRVQEAESAFTEPLSVEGSRSDVSDSLSLGLEDPILRIQDSPRVRVTARIREVHARKEFEAMPIAVRGGSASLRPGTVRVVVTGPASLLQRLTRSEVRPYVDVTALRGAGSVPVAVEFAPGLTGVKLEQAEPASVTARPLQKARG